MTGTLHRRHFAGFSAAAAVTALTGSRAGARNATPAASPVAGEWTFTDFLGRVITAPTVPTRIAAEIGAASALYDMGVQVHSVWGSPANDPEGFAEAWGRLPVESVVNISTTEGEVDVEKAVVEGTDLFVFGSTELDNPDSYGGFDNVAALLQAVAPLAAWPFTDRLDTTMEEIWRLALALGADPNSEANTAARADWESKVAEVQAITAMKPNLTTFFGYPTPTELYVANPLLWDDVNYFRFLGLNVVELDDDLAADWWEILSWEEALKYPTDTVFLANVSGSVTLAELEEHPTFQLHPAMTSGQTGVWSWYFARSPQGISGLIDNVLDVIRSAEVVTES